MTAEDFALADEPVPFHLTNNKESALGSISWPAQLVFGKLREWTGLKKADFTAAGSDSPMKPKVLKQAMIRLASKGILTVRIANVESLVRMLTKAVCETGSPRSNRQLARLQQLH